MEPMIDTPPADAVKAKLKEIIDRTASPSWRADAIMDDFVVIDRNQARKTAPAIALELLTAAGYTETSHASPDPLVWVSNAVRDLDAWAEAHLVEVQKNKRRDELAREFADGVMGARTDYAGLPTTQRRAIDRIIEIEAAL